MTLYNISISENNVWAGNGLRDEHGAITCDAILSAASADAQDQVYGPIEEAVTEAIEAGESTTTLELNGYEYYIQIEEEEEL